ncbi:probable Bax inhibitor 1 isoform X2 [Hydractinia symbiolongicarpus]|uniref:probable Bax inhibitor 1 isoform X2 n=1 Tax=Hydractinia symbiolongicarpus TaxID=13093 RepID=UPI00254F9F83|nr:probable Bax inhibitor 1 isoform X2 [Hydractinia symbiolongicarpus]
MDALFGERPISLRALTDFSKLDVQTKKHLKNVYSALAISTLSAAVGAGIHVLTHFLQGGLLAGLGSIGFVLALAFTENSSKNQIKRLGYLVGMAFCTGLSLGPLMDQVIEIDPTIVSTAFFASCLIFVCFSLSALWAEDRSYLYLGGTLFSGVSIMMLLSFMNIFFQSNLIFQVYLYGGLLLFCGFILYDTQLIIEKRRNGDDDFIWHSVDLFLDFINIFRRTMVILANNKKDKRKKN